MYYFNLDDKSKANKAQKSIKSLVLFTEDNNNNTSNKKEYNSINIEKILEKDENKNDISIDDGHKAENNTFTRVTNNNKNLIKNTYIDEKSQETPTHDGSKDLKNNNMFYKNKDDLSIDFKKNSTGTLNIIQSNQSKKSTELSLKELNISIKSGGKDSLKTSTIEDEEFENDKPILLRCKNYFQKIKILLCYFIISFNNSIIFNLMIIVYYFDFHVNYFSNNIENYYKQGGSLSSQENNKTITHSLNILKGEIEVISFRSICFNFSVIYLLIFIMHFTKICFDKHINTFSYQRFINSTIITFVVTIGGVIYFSFIKNLNKDNFMLLIAGMIIFSSQIFFSQNTLNEINLLAFSEENTKKYTIQKYVYYYSLCSRIIGISFVYLLNNKSLRVINDFVVLNKYYNLSLMLLSASGLIFNVFIVKTIKVDL